MKDELISFETAKLAKEKGFDLRLASYNYSEENEYEMGFNVYTKQDLLDYKIYPAPTQSLLQRWLRENLYLSVNVKHYPSGTYSYYILKHNGDAAGWNEIVSSTGNTFFTYEEALEVGLQEAL